MLGLLALRLVHQAVYAVLAAVRVRWMRMFVTLQLAVMLWTNDNPAPWYAKGDEKANFFYRLGMLTHLKLHQETYKLP